MRKPILVVMAAGMGSRYGGLKQMDPVGSNGELIIDFSIYDALKAGFEKVIFIIRREIEADFKERIGKRISKHMDVHYVYQELDLLPQGFKIPEERLKPWGTAHAILAAKDVIDAPFVVINADDYYGENAFSKIYNYLQYIKDEDNEYAMVGYNLKNTVTKHGHVARGICGVGEDDELVSIHERTHIEIKSEGIMYKEKNNQWHKIEDNAIVSMNLWGFAPTILEEIENGFVEFLNENLSSDPLKCEYLLPNVVGKMIKGQMVRVKVFKTLDKWYGVTYKEDKPVIVEAIKEFKFEGRYPTKLWED